MSVGLVIAGDDFAMAATDGRRVESGGLEARNNHPKTFRLNRSVVGCHTGLLEFGGKAIAQWLSEGARNVADAGSARLVAAMTLARSLDAISEVEVGRGHRNVDLLFASRDDATVNPRIVKYELAPREDLTLSLRSLATPGARWNVMGDSSAGDAVSRILQSVEWVGLPLKRAKAIAKEAIREGVAACGEHPLYRGVASCGGDAFLEWVD